MTILELLLNEISVINKKYEEFSRLSGENFNVFRVLGVESYEVRMHSNLIAELLNPNGSHGQNDVFLKLFCEEIKPLQQEFNTKTAKVIVEKHIAKVSETEGGRVDILVTDTNGKYIIIENKIYAGDQENQLIRYKNFGEKNIAKLLYLTLDGSVASDFSAKGLKVDEDYFAISYKTEIINWLEKCRKEVAILPVLRETITQYIHLIKYLTGLSTNKQMENEIAKLIAENEEKIKAAYQIKENLNAAENYLIDELIKKLSIEFSNEKKIVFEKTDKLYNEKYFGFEFKVKEWKSCKILFGFERQYKGGFFKSIMFKTESSENLKLVEEIKKAGFISSSGNTNLKVWAYWEWFKIENKTFDWNTFESTLHLKNDNIFKQIKTDIAEIIEKTKGLSL